MEKQHKAELAQLARGLSDPAINGDDSADTAMLIGQLIKSPTHDDRAILHTIGLIALYERVGDTAVHRGCAANSKAAHDWLNGLPLEEIDYLKVPSVSVGEDGEIVQ